MAGEKEDSAITTARRNQLANLVVEWAKEDGRSAEETIDMLVVVAAGIAKFRKKRPDASACGSELVMCSLCCGNRADDLYDRVRATISSPDETH